MKKGWIGTVCWLCGNGGTVATACVAGVITVFVCAGCVADNVSTMKKAA